MPRLRQVTTAAHDHVLTNVNCFSPDGQWLVYDVRSHQGERFDGDRIERVRLADGHVDVLYRGRNGANVGVATYNPVADEVVFICGPENPSPDFVYGPARRHGLIVDCASKLSRHLDARDITPPFTPGALRGGTHVHVFSPDGTMVSSTYEDHVLEQLATVPGDHDPNQRTIAVSVLGRSVTVSEKGPRDHDGSAFTYVAVRTTTTPRPGSDEIGRAVEEGWIGIDGYLRADGTRQRKALAFQGEVVATSGARISEVFVVDLPDEPIAIAGEPLEGTPTRRPMSPIGCAQRRLTYTAHRTAPGLALPRHWLRASADGSKIAFLMCDDEGVAQLWTVSPNGGTPRQITHAPQPVGSAFTWHPDGASIAHLRSGAVCVAEVDTGTTRVLTDAQPDARPQACVFSPDGRRIAFVRGTPDGRGKLWDQIWLVED